MIVNGMMRSMPYPKETMHDILMGEPCHEFPREKSCYYNKATPHVQHNAKILGEGFPVSLDRAVPCKSVFNNRLRVLISAQFRHPFPDVNIIRVEFFRLRGGIENAKVRSCIGAGTSRP